MRFNSVLGAFFFIVLACAVAVVVFVQSRSFGGLLTKVITDISEKKTDTKVGIRDISISVFPPGIELNKVSVEKNFPEGKTLQAELGTIGFYLNLIEIEERKLAFGEIRIADSVVDFRFPKKDGPPIEQIDQAIVNKAFDIVDELPVRVDTLLVENSKLLVNHELMGIRRLKLFKKDDAFTARFHIGNLRPSEELDLTIDEVWADADISKKNISIQRLRLQQDVHTLLIKGKVLNWPLLKRAELDLIGESQVHLRALAGMVELPDLIALESGSAQISFKMSMKNEKVAAESTLFLKDVRSNVLYADSLAADVSYSEGRVLVSRMELVHGQEKAALLEPVLIADVPRRSYLAQTIKAEVQDLRLNNALRILGPKFSVLKGSLTGRVAFSHRQGDLHFLPADGMLVRDLALVVGEKNFSIFKANRVQLKDSEFALVKGEFQMSSTVTLPRSQLEVDGYVNKQEARFSVADAKVNLEDLGDIAKLGIKGDGRLSVNVSGPLDDTELNFKGKMDGFQVLGYRLGTSDIDLSIGLGDSSVTIKKFESLFGKTSLSGNGVINYDSLDIALGVNSRSTNYHDVSQILDPIFSKLDFLPADLELNAKVDAYIFGKTRLEELKVKSHVVFQDLTAYGEGLDVGEFDVELASELLSIKNLKAKKEKGRVAGDFTFHLPSEMLKIKYSWDDLALSSFNLAKRLSLNFDGKLKGGIEGEGKVKDYELSVSSVLSRTRTENYEFPDSSFAVTLRPQRFQGDVSLFGEVLRSKFDWSLKKGERSQVTAAVDVPDFKPVMVAVFGQHLQSEDFNGRLKMDLKAAFNPGFADLDLSANLREWIFSHASFNVSYLDEEEEFIVEDSRIKKWDVNVRQPDLFMQTKGEGVFGKDVSLVHELHFNAKILEILLSQVLSSEGFIRSIVRVEGRGEDYDVIATSKSDGLGLSFDGAPFPLNDLKYDLEYAHNRLSIKRLTSGLESGSASLVGDIFFDGNEPDVNIKYELQRAEIPVLGKSSINLSGEGIILGNSMPYSLGGEIVLNKASIVNELNEFNSRSSALGQVRYLPKNQESPLSRLLTIDLNVKAENPIRITNSLMDVGLKGEVRLTGTPTRPRGDGRLFSPINASRIFFKNNEYFITNADINFSPKKEISNPDFDVQAVTYISSYKVNAKAYGDLERFNFDLTSDPMLARNSILSLIAFGYTDEIQSTLDPKEQQNLTQVGVGSFVFDRFKITDILSKQFGLQVNLGTVFEQSQTESMLAGRSQEGAGGTLARTRSATKIELKKRLDEALTLSVSSTMGGSIGQRQSMNLTYNVNKKVQLEGVYELRTNDEGQEDVQDNSLGGDLKFRWTFK